MKNQNNNLQPNNFFNKLKACIFNLFHKTIKKSFSEEIDNKAVKFEELKNNAKTNSFFEEYRLKNERRKYLLNLQRKYKSKEILEEDMKEEDRIDLENLYIEQNNELKRKIRAYDTQIAKMNKG